MSKHTKTYCFWCEQIKSEVIPFNKDTTTECECHMEYDPCPKCHDTLFSGNKLAIEIKDTPDHDNQTPIRILKGIGVYPTRRVINIIDSDTKVDTPECIFVYQKDFEELLTILQEGVKSQ